ncbi:MAG TPA: YHS domain-containing (seleno)protein [Ferruginibacter sp.]|nr:YHS domain-containing (seleno)protein [Ferruginibacter sp.]
MKKFFTILTAAFFLLFLSNKIYAQQAIRVAQFNTEKGLAIQGYDPVAYFTQSKAVKGNSDLSVNADGITYYFATAEDRELFKKDRKKYEPQYGGWCAYAMGANGEKVDIDPETFKILNGKLYLFYHSWVNNTLNKWNADEKNLQPKADASWAKFVK